MVVLSITGVVIRGPHHLGGQPMLHLVLRKHGFGVLVVATTDESHRIQIEALASSASPCLWELLRTFLKAPTVPCGPVSSTVSSNTTEIHRTHTSEYNHDTCVENSCSNTILLRQVSSLLKSVKTRLLKIMRINAQANRVQVIKFTVN